MRAALVVLLCAWLSVTAVGQERLVTTAPLALFTQSVTKIPLTVGPDGTVTIHKAADPNTVLCIEYEPYVASWTSGIVYDYGNGRYSYSPPGDGEPAGTYHGKPSTTPRVCATIETWRTLYLLAFARR